MRSAELHPLEHARLNEAHRIERAARISFGIANEAWLEAYVLQGQDSGETAAKRRRRMLKLDELERAELDVGRAELKLTEARVERHRGNMREHARARRRQAAGVG